MTSGNARFMSELRKCMLCSKISITLNQVNISEHKRRATVGTIEIGGASLQIAYEVPWDTYVPQDYSATINLGCDIHETIHEYKVYVVTHLGYGTDAARRRYIEG